ncbi:MAG: MlaD family protein [Bacteroidales bacterium]|nr:MlaD family protein [Bacteroidales bacterium]
MAKEYKIGIIVLAVLLLSVWGINFLKGKSMMTSDKDYYGVFSNIGGLEQASNVYINGLKVGRVTQIDFIDNDPGRILVAFAIPAKYNIPVDSRIEIYNTDLLGSKALTVVIGKDSRIASSQDTLQSGIQPDMISTAINMLEPIKVKAEILLQSMDSVMQDVHATLNPETRASIQDSLYQMESLLENEKAKIADILGNLRSVSENLKNSNEDISNITGNFSKVSDELAQARIGEVVSKAENTLKELEEILKNIREGKGSLGQMAVNEDLYQNLNRSISDLDSLFLDLKSNPKRYVHFSIFGNKTKEEKK